MPAAPQPDEIRLVVGLGNPGKAYERTRHNAGHATIDLLAERSGVRYWKSQAGLDTCEIRIAGNTITLAKPQTFMNESGGPVSKIARQLKIKPAEILVVHDDADVEEANFKLKFGGGHDGHNGLRSIIAKLGTRDFGRLRFGVGRPPGRMSLADYALRPLKGKQLQSFELSVQDAADIVEDICAHGFTQTQAKH